MLMTVGEFREYVRSDINGLITSVANMSRNVSDNEKQELNASYIQVSKMFGKAIEVNPEFAKVNIGSSEMLLEYKLPSASAWCDLVLLGDDESNRHQVMIVELKNWRKDSKDKPGDYEGSILHNGKEELHPCEQVKGYTEYCRFFHSEIRPMDEVNGCVYFTQKIDMTPYAMGPNIQLVKDYPTYNADDLSTSKLADRITTKITKPNPEFAEAFEKGVYKQDRNILKQVAENLSKLNSDLFGSMVSPFVLLEKQRSAYNHIMSELQKVKTGKKHVFIVKGNPGSGKSAIAANLWVDSAMKFRNKGNIAFVTTSDSQNDNWVEMFKGSKVPGAQHMIVKASSFKPSLVGIDDDGFKNKMRRIDANKYISPTGALDCRYYLDYIDYLLKNGYGRGYAKNNNFLSIVDEAHALVYPEKMRGMAMGWKIWAGPMAYNIIYCSQISVFFMDDKQGFRDRESTSIDDVTISRRVADLEAFKRTFQGSDTKEGTTVTARKIWGDLMNYMTTDKTTAHYERMVCEDAHKDENTKIELVNKEIWITSKNKQILEELQKYKTIILREIQAFYPEIQNLKITIEVEKLEETMNTINSLFDKSTK